MDSKLTKLKFYFLLITIALFGLSLRFIDYDSVPPFDVTKDEFFYPWAGMTFLQTGTPTAWSLFDAYPEGEIVYKWGTWYRIVSPWVEKPPLYPLLAGTWILANGTRDILDVRLSLLRILPILISFATIIILGLTTKRFFGTSVALISIGLYSVNPTIVMSNRLSLVENLLTPLALLVIYFFQLENKNKFWMDIRPYIIGLLLGAVVLTKNIGVSLSIVILAMLLFNKNWKELTISGAITIFSFIIHPLIGLYFGWNQFVEVLKDYREVHALTGLPEVTSTIFRFPIVGHQWDKIFPDGTMLAGYILFFSSPFWLKVNDFIVKKQSQLVLFLGFPFVYTISLALLESGGTPYSYFGWHVYPLFPFLIICLAKVIYDFWKNPGIFQAIFLYLIIGLSSVRFLLLIFQDFQKTWQFVLASLLIFLIGSFFLQIESQKKILWFLLLFFLIVNILTVLNLNEIYPGNPQPYQ